MYNLKKKILKIDQLTFIQDFIKEKNFSSYNLTNILIKAGSFINMHEENNNEKTNLKSYQQLVSKLIYLLCNTRSDIVFKIR